ncbi:serine protease [Zoogloea sp.]|uniref:S1 family peptidase n=1 Tax=Zoogloea sp. TaxID=49181 RepID=UPI0014167934|nr:MAG: trypsin-like peptidase domain-containing protein [Zoogloea sp.]
MAALAAGLLAPLPVLADLVSTVASVKRSIVAVGTFLPTRSPQFRFLGTGFVVGDGNQVATNVHVLASGSEQRSPNERIVVVLPGVGRVSVRAVEREVRDMEHDLAVMWIAGPALPPLVLSDSNSTPDGLEIALTGFPLGATLGVIPATHKGIISASVPAGLPLNSSAQLDSSTIHRLAAGARFDVLQLDVVSYPGNSGSPVYDTATGEVVGVLNMVLVNGIRQNAVINPSRISYAIPVSHLKALLAR